MNIDLKCIKHKYGEKMMHLCRKLFPTILEEEGLLFKTLSDNFDYSKELADDLINNSMVTEFKNYIFSLIQNKKHYKESNKTVKELLEEVGYNLYECKTEEDIQKFRKYYVPGETLCTFTDDRLKDSYVFFAVKKNVDEIKREDFQHPSREDLYGTSVISIQFTKGDTNTLGIMNRYNHTVNNADATFSNNLENINPGLTKAFEKEYGLNIYSNRGGFELPNYVKTLDGKYYKYNFEKNGIYYCPNNIIIDQYKAKKYDKEKYIIMDYFVLDLQNKTITTYNSNQLDTFIEGINPIHSIKVFNEDKENKKIIINDNIEILLDHQNRILKYKNPNIYELDHRFMDYRRDSVIESLDLPNVEKIKEDFFENNKSLKEIKLANVMEIENNFIRHNNRLKKIYAPNILKIGNDFLANNEEVDMVYFPKVLEIGNNFFLRNKKMNHINIDNVRKIGNNFLAYNNSLENMNLRNVEEIKDSFMIYNNTVKRINCPKLKVIRDSFLYTNSTLEELDIPSVIIIGNNFLRYNEEIKHLYFPNLIQVGSNFMQYNNKIKEIHFPRVKQIGYNFMNMNTNMEKVILEEAKIISKFFLDHAIFIKKVFIPNIEEISESNLNETIKESLKKKKRSFQKIIKRNG